MRSFLSIFLFSFVVSVNAWAENCLLQGQVIVQSNGGQYSIHECLPGMAGGLTAKQLNGRYLADFIEANQNNAKVKKMLDIVVPGMPLKDVLAALKDNNTLVTPNPEELAEVAELYNERMGVNADLENLRAKKIADAKKTNRSISDLSDIAQNNSTNLPNLQKNCKGQLSDEQRLRPLVIDFADGEKQTSVITGIQKLDNGTYQVRLMTEGDEEEQTRTIETDGGQLVWVGKDGKKWPLSEKPFTEITDAAATTIRDFNSIRGEDGSCYLARKLPQISSENNSESPESIIH